LSGSGSVLPYLLLLPIVLVLGHATAVTGIVGWLLGRNVPRLGITRLLFYLILGALVVGLAGIIPFTGTGIVLVVMIFGVGAFLRAVLWRFRQTRDSGPRDDPFTIKEMESEPSVAENAKPADEVIELSEPVETIQAEKTTTAKETKEPPENQ